MGTLRVMASSDRSVVAFAVLLTVACGGVEHTEVQDGPPPDAGTPSPNPEFAYLIAESATSGGSQARATFYPDPQPNPACAYMAPGGSCVLTMCPAYGSQDAGPLSMYTSSTFAQLSYENGAYSGVVATGPGFGSSMDVTATGGGTTTVDSDQFGVNLIFPSQTVFTSLPSIASFGQIDTGAPLGMTWSPISSEVLFLLYATMPSPATDYPALLCIFSGAVSSAVVPQETLQEFKQMAFGSTDVIVAFSSLERLSVMSAGWSIEVVGIYDAIPNGGYDHIQLL
jgi:hypothetical protein